MKVGAETLGGPMRLWLPLFSPSLVALSSPRKAAGNGMCEYRYLERLNSAALEEMGQTALVTEACDSPPR